MTPDYDVLIVGAGLSGIGVACQLQQKMPFKRFAIIERRDNIGGTWDLFRYPGVRSDTDMYTLGYKFKPWNKPEILADGSDILNYIRDTATENQLLDRIHFSHKITHADWSSKQRCWTLNGLNEKTGKPSQYTAKFVINCTGYYNYDKGYAPKFTGSGKFKGQLIHPQFWPENLDYKDKKIVVIGSGATAITLVPSLAKQAEHVTMLQRSPSYILSLPRFDFMSAPLYKFLPKKVIYKFARARSLAGQRLIFKTSREKPAVIKRMLRLGVRSQLDDKAQLKHFTPKYQPWDQRLCVVPDGDLFKAINCGDVNMVTDEIATFNEAGIQLKSGKQIDADIVVTATGLELQMLGGAKISVDKKTVSISDSMIYKGALVEGVPNLSVVFGYTNTAWTVKVDLVAAYLCRLFKFMDNTGADYVIPKDSDGCATDETVMGAMKSGYVQRAANRLPRQGSKEPWAVLNNYFYDKVLLQRGAIEDPALQFVGQDAFKPLPKKTLGKFIQRFSPLHVANH